MAENEEDTLVLSCSFEGCYQQAVLLNRQSVLLGKDETCQQFVFRVYHSCFRHAVYYVRSEGDMLYQQEKVRGLQRMFFLLTPAHIALAKRLSITWDDADNGAPGANTLRPYGNSSLMTDIASAIGYRQCGGDEWYSDDEERYLENLHREMHLVLQIILHTGQMKAGIYKKPRVTEEWVLVKHPECEAELVLALSENEVPLPHTDRRRILAELIRQLREEDFSDAEIARVIEQTTRGTGSQRSVLSGDIVIPASLAWSISTVMNEIMKEEN